MSERRLYYAANDVAVLAPRAALPWTICILFYGDYPNLSRRALEKLYRYTDPELFRLRAGLNAVCTETDELVEEMAASYGNVTIHRSEKNIFIGPMMRRMFHDPLPETLWIVWFDDDSRVIGPNWVMDLALAMEHAPDAELFGPWRGIGVDDRSEAFITSAPWHRGVPRQIHAEDGKPTIEFPVGSFCAIRTERVVELDWPDPRLVQVGNDYFLAEAMRQIGAKFEPHETGVACDDEDRRWEEDAHQLRLD